MNRRSFLTGIIAAPVVMKAEALMPVWPWMPVLYGDGIHDDWAGLQALLKGEDVDIRSRTIYVVDRLLGFSSINNQYSLSRSLVLPSPSLRRDIFVGDTFTARPGFRSDGAMIMGHRNCALLCDGAYVEGGMGMPFAQVSPFSSGCNAILMNCRAQL